MEMIVLYENGRGMYIVRINDGKYYYGDGEEVNSLGISANQFLRFNPYMKYVGAQKKEPNEKIKRGIEKCLM